MLVQPIGADGKDVGRPLVAVDSVGAGVGETVFFVRGREASFPFHPTEVPTDAGIVGIVDHYSVATNDDHDLGAGVGTVVGDAEAPAVRGREAAAGAAGDAARRSEGRDPAGD